MQSGKNKHCVTLQNIKCLFEFYFKVVLSLLLSVYMPFQFDCEQKLLRFDFIA